MSEAGGWRREVGNVLRPLRPVYAGMVVLLALYLICMSIGIHNTVVLPHPGDRAMLFLLATIAWPGPYVFYMVFCFFLFHARRSIAMTLTFNITCLMMALILFAEISWNARSDGSIAFGLHEAMYQNFIAAMAIGALSLGLLFLLAPGAKRTNRPGSTPPEGGRS
jgi:hypothetical protein